jgi:hypothetical protein
MKKYELAGLRLKGVPYQKVLDLLPSSFDGLGITADAEARDGSFTIRDYGERGCVVLLPNGDLAQRAARVLAPKLAQAVQAYVVNGTSANRFRFRAAAFEATPDGHIRDIPGEELDFDDPEQQWGGGSLEARTERVLKDFGAMPTLFERSKILGYKRVSAGKASSPRVATLLAILKKARTWEGVPTADGRVELRVGLAAGGKQTSFCTAAEFAELEALTGRGR